MGKVRYVNALIYYKNQRNKSDIFLSDGIDSLKGMNCSDQILYQVADIKANVLTYVRIISDSSSMDEQNVEIDHHSSDDDELGNYHFGSSSGEEAEFDSDTHSFEKASRSEEIRFDSKSLCSSSSGEEAEF